MMNENHQLGPDTPLFQKLENGWEVLFERDFEHPPELLWDMLTSESRLPLWLAPGYVECHVGGRATIQFEASGMPIDSRVTQCDPYRMLGYDWGDSDQDCRPLLWTLTPTDSGTRLHLRLGLCSDDPVPVFAAGWDTHLEMLGAALEGIPVSFQVARFRESRSRFESLLAA